MIAGEAAQECASAVVRPLSSPTASQPLSSVYQIVNTETILPIQVEINFNWNVQLSKPETVMVGSSLEPFSAVSGASNEYIVEKEKPLG